MIEFKTVTSSSRDDFDKECADFDKECTALLSTDWILVKIDTIIWNAPDPKDTKIFLFAYFTRRI